MSETNTKKKDPEMIDISFAQDAARTINPFVKVQMRLFLRPSEKIPQEWIIKGNSMVQINGKARQLCKENGRRFPIDVELWEVLQ